MNALEMPSGMYAFVRGRQLDGTFPGSPLTGVWPITDLRVRKGWGMPPESAWPYRDQEWPPSEPPEMDELAKRNRLFAYTRIRTLNDARRVLIAHSLVGAGFEIDGSWDNASEGRIAHPRDHSPDRNHFVTIYGYDDEAKELKFRNSWGESWGDRGDGVLPYAYWEDRLIESWYLDLNRPSSPWPAADRLVVVSAGVYDDFGRPLHFIEMTDRTHDELVGWAFAVEMPETLDIEELFVRPKYRRKGYGTELATAIDKLRETRQKRLVAWIPHGDLLGPGPKRVLDRLGLTVGASPERWAAGLAVHLPDRS